MWGDSGLGNSHLGTRPSSCRPGGPAHLSLDERHGPDGLLQLPHLVHGAHDERGARVHDGLTALLAQGQAAAHVDPAGVVGVSPRATQHPHRASCSPGRRLSPLSGLEQSGSRAQKPRAGSRPVERAAGDQRHLGPAGPRARPIHGHNPSQTDQGLGRWLPRDLLAPWGPADQQLEPPPPRPKRGSASTHCSMWTCQ